MKNDVIVIGGGPAGITAAIQLKRYGYNPLLIEKNRLGGLLRNARKVENYIGHPSSPSGEELASDFIKQFNQHDIETKNENVLSLDYTDNVFSVKTNKSEYMSDTVIVASGTKGRVHPVCVDLSHNIKTEIADLNSLEDKAILIVGAGDASFDYALSLAEKNSVMIINRGNDIKALDLLKKRVFENKSIRYMSDTRLEAVTQKNEDVVSAKLQYSNGECKEFDFDYVVNAIGRYPQRDFFSDKLVRDEIKLQKTGKLHLIGDVKNALFRQVAISTGDGLMAAMKINDILQEEKNQ